MKKEEVKLNSVYAVKVSGIIRPVRLDKASPLGGWTGTNLATHREVRIWSAAKLRFELEPTGALGSDPKWRRKGGKKT
jgi:hypothetical protein